MGVDIPALRALLAAASPEPWEEYSASCCPDMGGVQVRQGSLVCPSSVGQRHPMTFADASAVASLRNQALELLDELEGHRKHRTGLCSAHQYGEDPSCTTCHGIGPEGVAKAWLETAQRLQKLRDAAILWDTKAKMGGWSWTEFQEAEDALIELVRQEQKLKEM